MRILVITPYFYPHPGGSQQYIEGLYTALKAVQPELEVDVLCYNTDSQPAKEKYGIFHIYRVPCVQLLSGQFALPNYLAVNRLVNKLKKSGKTYDIVNAHTRFFESSWWAPFVAKKLNAKSVFTDHCASAPWHPNPIVRFVAKQVDRFITPVIARRYDKVTVVAEATKKYLNSLGAKVDAVIPCGVDTENEASERPISREKNDTIVIGFVGRMITSKHPEIVLEVIEKLNSEGLSMDGLMVGGGPLLTQLQSKQIKHVEFTGPLSHDKTQEALSKIDILLHPSVHHEGLPMVLLEAGKAGCAVIASPQGGSTEVVVDQETGLIAKPTVDDFYQAVLQLMNEPQQTEKYGQALQKKVKKEFNWSKISADYAQLLNTLSH